MLVKNEKNEVELNFGKQELKALDHSIRNLFEMFSKEQLDLWVSGELDLYETINELYPDEENILPEQKSIGGLFESHTIFK